MPELPEVETIASELRRSLVGGRVTSVRVLWPRTIAQPEAAILADLLPGRAFVSVSRRGKYLLLGLDSGDTLIVHLRMTGRLEILPGNSPAMSDKHVRAWFELADERSLVFTDQRKFGRIWLVGDVAEVIGKLGPELLDWSFTPDDLAERVRPRRVAMKALLLDQTAVAGLGNIYADESLFLAGIHPLRTGASLTDEEIGRLHDAIRQVLGEAIGARGTTLRDYRPAYGVEGAYQNRLRVYGQPDQPCPHCGATIQRIRVAQRSTHFCPICQPAAGSRTSDVSENSDA